MITLAGVIGWIIGLMFCSLIGGFFAVIGDYKPLIRFFGIVFLICFVLLLLIKLCV